MSKTFIILLLSLCLSGFSKAQQTINASITHDGLQRDYILHIPPSYNSNNPSPLLLCFHGYTSSANTIMSYTYFNLIADTANFIVVYPQGTVLNGYTHWNVGGWTTGSTVDDLGFAGALLDSISAEYNIDATRIYSTGMSNGGYMSFLLACQLNDRIAAIASVTGSMTPQMYGACSPQHSTPVLQIHGNADSTVPYNGDPTWTKSIADVLQYWTSFNNCTASPVISPVPDYNLVDGSTVEHYLYADGDNCTSVEHYKVLGGGHDWPGAWGNMDISASFTVWEFLSRYDINGLIGCQSTGNDNIVVSEVNCKIYPIPAANFIHFEGTNNKEEAFEIISLLGEKVLTGFIDPDLSRINISGLSPDVYILKVSGRSYKIVKSY